MLRYALTAAALGLIPATALSAQAVTNGGFENPVVAPPCCNTVPPDSLPGWTVSTGNTNVVLGTYGSTNGNLAYEGNQYLDLVGQGGIGSIYQDLTTSVGQVYTITFAYSHNLFTPSSATSASASVGVGTLFDIITHNTGDTSNLDWRVYTNTFTATAPTTRLTFTNLTGGVNEGVFLDAISVAAVPEPSTWMMMLLGLAGIGFMTYRRNSKPALMAS